MTGTRGVRLAELRVLEGPNLYFTRPAIKVRLSVPGWVAATEARALAAADRLHPGGGVKNPGPPGTDQRLRFVARVATLLTRSLSRAAGSRVAVRARAGPGPNEIVVAFPWRRRTAAEAFGREIARLLGALLGSRSEVSELVESSASRVAVTDPGPAPEVPAPRIPVVAVTGTNGKTTTVRLLAHLLRTAGLRVAYASTDGVYVGHRLVEAGDYSGPGGAAMALAQPGVEAVVLETARGGILLKGIGVAHNDVAVVTNVSADHLGSHGIRTLDQLTEVKATIVRITKRDGWDVLNADDPRVASMRRQATGRPFVFSMDPDNPGIRAALEEHGRGMSVVDGWLTVLGPGAAVRPLVPLLDVPVTLAGISTQHTENAMAAAAAALGIGLPAETVARGLRSFVLDPDRNPGRANLFTVDRRVIVVDYAHNEEGVKGLVEIAGGLRPPGGETWLVYSSAGDRSPEIMHAMGFAAARGADHVGIATLGRYLRERTPEEVIGHLRAGAVEAGAEDVPDFPDELHALAWLLRRSSPGDVLALTALGQRTEVFDRLERLGARRVGLAGVRRLALRAVGPGPTGPDRAP